MGALEACVRLPSGVESSKNSWPCFEAFCDSSSDDALRGSEILSASSAIASAPSS